jgi:hypothetical protein
MKGWRSEIDDINSTIIKFGDEAGVTTVLPPASRTARLRPD